jgi:energy-coupling factor transporter ATP-binding protein EcfA2
MQTHLHSNFIICALNSMTTTHPKSIYENVIKLVAQAITGICNTDVERNASEEIARQRGTAIEVLRVYHDQISKDVARLKELSEWDVFTISVYGETNAGKSTLIETLRILLNEESKVRQHATFRDLSQGLDLDGDQCIQLQKEVQQLEVQSMEAQSVLETLKADQQNKEQQAHDALSKLQNVIKTRKQALGLLQKIIHWFKKLEEESQLAAGRHQLVELQATHECAIRQQEAIELKQINHQFEKLVPYQDGDIIGNGRSDFTLSSQTYNFSVNGQKFALIDVPGIEGKEERVSDAIYESVKKSHAVFYITPKAAPPNKGDGRAKGTLEKIKEHLSDQTEVWAVFNKRITNPIGLRGEHLLDEGEIGGLKDLEKQLKVQLGESYQGVLFISALPAFYAAAQCILPTHAHHAQRRKFLKAMTPQELLNKTYTAPLCNFISRNICSDYKDKIRRANLKKIRASLEQGDVMLGNIKQGFQKAAVDLEQQITFTQQELDKICTTTASRIKSKSKDAVLNAKSVLRRDIYSDIDDNISNDDFKSAMERRVDSINETLSDSLQKVIEGQQASFAAEIVEAINRLNKNSSEILDMNLSRGLDQASSKFSLNFKIDNGINTIGLISTLGGAVLLAWNPAGWVLAAIGAASLLFSLFKAVRGFFSSDYKKEQQRKSADENIGRLFDEIESGLKKNTKKAGKELQAMVDEIKTAIKAPLNNVITINRVIAEAETGFKQIAMQLH